MLMLCSHEFILQKLLALGITRVYNNDVTQFLPSLFSTRQHVILVSPSGSSIKFKHRDGAKTDVFIPITSSDQFITSCVLPQSRSGRESDQPGEIGSRRTNHVTAPQPTTRSLTKVEHDAKIHKSSWSDSKNQHKSSLSNKRNDSSTAGVSETCTKLLQNDVKIAERNVVLTSHNCELNGNDCSKTMSRAVISGPSEDQQNKPVLDLEAGIKQTWSLPDLVDELQNGLSHAHKSDVSSEVLNFRSHMKHDNQNLVCVEAIFTDLKNFKDNIFKVSTATNPLEVAIGCYFDHKGPDFVKSLQGGDVYQKDNPKKADHEYTTKETANETKLNGTCLLDAQVNHSKVSSLDENQPSLNDVVFPGKMVSKLFTKGPSKNDNFLPFSATDVDSSFEQSEQALQQKAEMPTSSSEHTTVTAKRFDTVDLFHLDEVTSEYKQMKCNNESVLENDDVFGANDQALVETSAEFQLRILNVCDVKHKSCQQIAFSARNDSEQSVEKISNSERHSLILSEDEAFIASRESIRENQKVNELILQTLSVFGGKKEDAADHSSSARNSTDLLRSEESYPKLILEDNPVVSPLNAAQEAKITDIDEAIGAMKKREKNTSSDTQDGVPANNAFACSVESVLDVTRPSDITDNATKHLNIDAEASTDNDFCPNLTIDNAGLNKDNSERFDSYDTKADKCRYAATPAPSLFAEESSSLHVTATDDYIRQNVNGDLEKLLPGSCEFPNDRMVINEKSKNLEHDEKQITETIRSHNMFSPLVQGDKSKLNKLIGICHNHDLIRIEENFTATEDSEDKFLDAYSKPNKSVANINENELEQNYRDEGLGLETENGTSVAFSSLNKIKAEDFEKLPCSFVDESEDSKNNSCDKVKQMEPDRENVAPAIVSGDEFVSESCTSTTNSLVSLDKMSVKTASIKLPSSISNKKDYTRTEIYNSPSQQPAINSNFKGQEADVLQTLYKDDYEERLNYAKTNIPSKYENILDQENCIESISRLCHDNQENVKANIELPQPFTESEWFNKLNYPCGFPKSEYDSTAKILSNERTGENDNMDSEYIASGLYVHISKDSQALVDMKSNSTLYEKEYFNENAVITKTDKTQHSRITTENKESGGKVNIEAELNTDMPECEIKFSTDCRAMANYNKTGYDAKELQATDSSQNDDDYLQISSLNKKLNFETIESSAFESFDLSSQCETNKSSIHSSSQAINNDILANSARYISDNVQMKFGCDDCAEESISDKIKNSEEAKFAEQTVSYQERQQTLSSSDTKTEKHTEEYLKGNGLLRLGDIASVFTNIPLGNESSEVCETTCLLNTRSHSVLNDDGSDAQVSCVTSQTICSNCNFEDTECLNSTTIKPNSKFNDYKTLFNKISNMNDIETDSDLTVTENIVVTLQQNGIKSDATNVEHDKGSLYLFWDEGFVGENKESESDDQIAPRSEVDFRLKKEANNKVMKANCGKNPISNDETKNKPVLKSCLTPSKLVSSDKMMEKQINFCFNQNPTEKTSSILMDDNLNTPIVVDTINEQLLHDDNATREHTLKGELMNQQPTEIVSELVNQNEARDIARSIATTDPLQQDSPNCFETKLSHSNTYVNKHLAFRKAPQGFSYSEFANICNHEGSSKVEVDENVKEEYLDIQESATIVEIQSNVPTLISSKENITNTCNFDCDRTLLAETVKEKACSSSDIKHHEQQNELEARTSWCSLFTENIFKEDVDCLEVISENVDETIAVPQNGASVSDSIMSETTICNEEICANKTLNELTEMNAKLSNKPAEKEDMSTFAQSIPISPSFAFENCGNNFSSYQLNMLQENIELYNRNNSTAHNDLELKDNILADDEALLRAPQENNDFRSVSNYLQHSTHSFVVTNEIKCFSAEPNQQNNSNNEPIGHISSLFDEIVASDDRGKMLAVLNTTAYESSTDHQTNFGAMPIPEHPRESNDVNDNEADFAISLLNQNDLPNIDQVRYSSLQDAIDNDKNLIENHENFFSICHLFSGESLNKDETNFDASVKILQENTIKDKKICLELEAEPTCQVQLSSANKEDLVFDVANDICTQSSTSGDESQAIIKQCDLSRNNEDAQSITEHLLDLAASSEHILHEASTLDDTDRSSVSDEFLFEIQQTRVDLFYDDITDYDLSNTGAQFNSISSLLQQIISDQNDTDRLHVKTVETQCDDAMQESNDHTTEMVQANENKSNALPSDCDNREMKKHNQNNLLKNQVKLDKDEVTQVFVPADETVRSYSLRSMKHTVDNGSDDYLDMKTHFDENIAFPFFRDRQSLTAEKEIMDCHINQNSKNFSLLLHDSDILSNKTDNLFITWMKAEALERSANASDHIAMECLRKNRTVANIQNIETSRKTSFRKSAIKGKANNTAADFSVQLWNSASPSLPCDSKLLPQARMEDVFTDVNEKENVSASVVHYLVEFQTKSLSVTTQPDIVSVAVSIQGTNSVTAIATTMITTLSSVSPCCSLSRSPPFAANRDVIIPLLPSSITSHTSYLSTNEIPFHQDIKKLCSNDIEESEFNIDCNNQFKMLDQLLFLERKDKSNGLVVCLGHESQESGSHDSSQISESLKAEGNNLQSLSQYFTTKRTKTPKSTLAASNSCEKHLLEVETEDDCLAVDLLDKLSFKACNEDLAIKTNEKTEDNTDIKHDQMYDFERKRPFFPFQSIKHSRELAAFKTDEVIASYPGISCEVSESNTENQQSVVNHYEQLLSTFVQNDMEKSRNVAQVEVGNPKVASCKQISVVFPLPFEAESSTKLLCIESDKKEGIMAQHCFVANGNSRNESRAECSSVEQCVKPQSSSSLTISCKCDSEQSVTTYFEQFHAAALYPNERLQSADLISSIHHLPVTICDPEFVFASSQVRNSSNLHSEESFRNFLVDHHESFTSILPSHYKELFSKEVESSLCYSFDFEKHSKIPEKSFSPQSDLDLKQLFSDVKLAVGFKSDSAVSTPLGLSESTPSESLDFLQSLSASSISTPCNFSYTMQSEERRSLHEDEAANHR